MPQSRPHTAFVRAVIIQILVQLAGDTVFHSRFHPVSSRPCAEPLAEASRSAPLLSRAMAELRDSGAGPYTSSRALTEGAFLPVFDIRMPLTRETAACNMQVGVSIIASVTRTRIQPSLQSTNP